MDGTARSQQLNKQGWDQRTWGIALAMSAVIAALIFVSVISPLERLVGVGNSGAFAAMSAVFAGLVFPPVLSGIARRRTLLWAYYPLLAFTVWLVIGAFVDSVGPWTDVDSSSPDVSTDPALLRTIVLALIVLFLSPLVSAGPVCLYRVVRRRAIARQAASDAVLHHAMLTRQEGVWPPPPAQMMQESPAENGE
jgi:MFS family permease